MIQAIKIIKHIIKKVFIFPYLKRVNKIQSILEKNPGYYSQGIISAIIQSPGSKSLNDSEKSYSESWSKSQQPGQVLTFSEEINPSAIRSRVSSHGQKNSPQKRHFKFIILFF
jgi:hypothetical protein